MNTAPYSRIPFSISMQDGSLLHGEEWRLHPKPRRGKAPDALAMPLLCLPSELGNRRDFEPFLAALMALPGAPRQAFTLDMRGRGQSSDAVVDDTGLETDSRDLVTVLDVLGLHHCAVVVSGRGALPLFKAVIARPGAVAKLVLNDAGPALDNVGIARQTALRQRQASAKTWDEARDQMKALWAQDFPESQDDDFMAMAKLNWRDEGGKPVLNRNSKLKRLSNTVNYDERQPELWKEFALFRRCPSLLIRGEHSTLLSEEIAGEMASVHGNLTRLEAYGQGHVPDLSAPGLPEAIMAFLRD